MRQWQATAVTPSGGTVIIGVAADNRDAAELLAAGRLPECTAVTVDELPTPHERLFGGGGEHDERSEGHQDRADDPGR